MSEAHNIENFPIRSTTSRDGANTDPYGVARWGAGFITILENGHIGLTHPERADATPTDLVTVINNLNQRGITTPILLRVIDFLDYRIHELHRHFSAAISELDYRGHYQGVFPIKVNQQAQVIDRIVSCGRQYNFGLEVGSKAELLIALSHDLTYSAAVICNGTKDDEFIRLSLMSQRIGFNTFLVIESPRELGSILDIADELKLRPQLGIRIKLTHETSGKWAASSGDRSSFGLSITETMDVIDQLRSRDYLDCLVLQHSHLGSQIPDMLEIRTAVHEACRFFTEITAMGAPLSWLDIGGGLGVDYTGEQKAGDNSINYSLPEYCVNVVETVKFAMDEAGILHPTLITESGRACVAFSSVLLFNVLEATHYDSDERILVAEDDHHLIKSMIGIEDYLSKARAHECWNDLIYYRFEIRDLFRHAKLDFASLVKAERAYFYLIHRLKSFLLTTATLDDEIEATLSRTADIYHCNFSLFQSLPDIWAINQIHPIAPLQRLTETPSRRAVLSDITCDSDGRINRFVLTGGISHTLPVHTLQKGEDYYLGVFFVGAYQETLGDLHNLFGDTHVATIELRDDGGFDLRHEQEGDSVGEVLSYVEYQPRQMIDNFKNIVERAVVSGHLSPRDRREMTATYKDSLNGYTYFEYDS